MTAENLQLPHKLTLDQRNRLTMTGAVEVIRFEDTIVVLRTSMGVLAIQGTQLKLKNLTAESGQLSVEGQITGLMYEEDRSAQGFWRRLFS